MIQNNKKKIVADMQESVSQIIIIIIFYIEQI